jgi:glycine dehydrogenase subunit 1
VALMTTIFLTVYGKEGMRELGEHNLAKANYLKSVLGSTSGEGAKVLFEGAPRFHEFVLDLPGSAEEINTALLEHKIIGGLPLTKWYPELGPNASLWCATELTTRKQMDAAADALKAVVPAAELTRA